MVPSIKKLIVICTIAASQTTVEASAWQLADNIDYGCVVESAHWSQFDGEAGAWSNAPKSFKLRRTNCKNSTLTECRESGGFGSVLTLSPRLTGREGTTNYWGLLGSYSDAIDGSLELEEDVLFGAAIGMTPELEMTVFLLSARCFELGK
jgi:hypothetical protein